MSPPNKQVKGKGKDKPEEKENTKENEKTVKDKTQQKDVAGPSSKDGSTASKDTQDTNNTTSKSSEKDENKDKDKEKEKEKDESKDSKPQKETSNVKLGMEVKNKAEEVVETTAASLSLSSIAEFLKVVVSSNVLVSYDSTGLLQSLDSTMIKTPKVITKIEKPELRFMENPHKWCLMIGRIRSHDSEFTDYFSFIKHLSNLITMVTDEICVIYQIQDKVDIHLKNVMNPTSVGLGDDFLALQHATIRYAQTDGISLFAPKASSRAGYTSIPIVINPLIQDLVRRTHKTLERDGRNVRKWINRFIKQKRDSDCASEIDNFAHHDVSWLPVASPENLSLFLSTLPNINSVSVPCSLEYVYPECTTSQLDVSSFTQNLKVNSTRNDYLSTIATDLVSSKNYEDFKSIITAMVLPQQVQIVINPKNSGLPAEKCLTALFAKMIFSTTHGFQNIENSSAERMDRYLHDYLINSGFNSLDNSSILAFRADDKNHASIAPWVALKTDLYSGNGWVNHSSCGSIRIEEPLYVGVSNLPRYADFHMDVRKDPDADIDSNNSPAIYMAIMRALSTPGPQSSKDLFTIRSILQYIRPNYLKFISSLNRHIELYGETGFRMSDISRERMHSSDMVGGNVNERQNTPVILNISSESLIKFALRFPTTFAPSPRITRQIITESAASSQIQNVFAMHDAITTWVIKDKMTSVAKPKRILREIIDSLSDSSIIKRIFGICFDNYAIDKYIMRDIKMVVSLADDIFALTIPDVSQEIFTNPEVYGLTKSVISEGRNVIVMDQEYVASYEKTGILCDNTYPDLHNYNIHNMTYEVMNDKMSTLSLLSYLVPKPDCPVRVVLPIYMKYKEVHDTKWPSESVAYEITGLSNNMNRGSIQNLKWGTFTRTFVTPESENTRTFPDQFLIGVQYLKFWFSKDITFTQTATPAALGGWILHVDSALEYIKFKPPTELTYHSSKEE